MFSGQEGLLWENGKARTAQVAESWAWKSAGSVNPEGMPDGLGGLDLPFPLLSAF